MYDNLNIQQTVISILDELAVLYPYEDISTPCGAYNQNLKTTPEQDMMDMLSNINDNDKIKLDLYYKTKQQKFEKVKNRIKKDQPQNQ